MSQGQKTLVAFAITFALSIVAHSSLEAVQSAGAADARSAFEARGVLDRAQIVLVRPMIESDLRVAVRARAAGVPQSSLRAKAYGLRIDVLFPDAEIGAAFMRTMQVYRLGLRNAEISLDHTYYYCNGFQSVDIVRVTEKRWSETYAEGLSFARLEPLAEAVRNGSGHREAFAALEPGGELGLYGGQKGESSERQVTWLTGRQLIETVPIELTRAPDVGNQVRVRFAR